ncbi:hypothetical protein PhCBS80983_g05179 [Powellomyces hirtus]|uniref:SH3 domain-containing protein n=1 Tax=Powellomyces hirtus TaxID=109895 RepID=A0A507DVV6_9FUNG|nr:hypothetical protein PhCBS80983_g05179 [Powellomyces hirtus]
MTLLKILASAAATALLLFLPSTQAKCVDVSATTVCADYAKSSGQTVKIETGDLPGAGNVTDDVVTFDNWVTSTVGAIPVNLQCSVLTDMAKEQGVSSYRYANSYACQLAFMPERICSEPKPTVPKLCKSTCTWFMDSVIKGGFNTEGMCTKDPGAVAAQAEWKLRGDATCNALDEATGCLAAVPSEVKNCGTGTSAAARVQAQALCRQDPNMPCCIREPALLEGGTGLDGPAYDRLPLIAGLIGGFFFAVIALVFSLIQYFHHKDGSPTNVELPRVRSVHAQRAESAARNSQLWNDAAPHSNARDQQGWNPKLQQQQQQQPYYPNSQQHSDIDVSSSTTPKAPPQAAAGRASISTLAAHSAKPPRQSFGAGDQQRRTANNNGISRIPSRHSIRSDSHQAALRDSQLGGTNGFHRAVVNESYNSTEHDEISLQTGDVVHVQQVFDDGWGWGVNTSTGKEGAFPVVCLSNL